MYYANDLKTRFLKQLCKIKNWHYQTQIEIQKDSEIRKFLSCYLHDKLKEKISSARLQLLFEHAAFKNEINALTSLMEHANNEAEFIDNYNKVTGAVLINNGIRFE